MGRVFTDDFNRANENLQVSPNWEVDLMGVSQGMVVSSNAAWARGSSSYANVGTPSDTALGTAPIGDHSSQCKISQHGSLWGLGVRVLTYVAGPSYFNGYGVEISTTKIELKRYIDWLNLSYLGGAPSRVTLGTWTNTISVGDVIKIAAVGTTISVKVNGTERISVTDATHSTGYPAVYGTSAGGGIPIFDDYEATDNFVPAGGGGSPLLVGGIDGSWNRNMGHP